MRRLAALLILLPTLAFSAERSAADAVAIAGVGVDTEFKLIVGRVSHVVDGDTFDVSNIPRRRIRHWRRIPSQLRIRLCGINAPDRDEHGYAASKEHLTDLILGKVVRCVVVGSGTPCDGRSKKRSHNRVVAQCWIKTDGGLGWQLEKDIAGAMVRAGHARDWPKFSGGFYKR